MPLIVPPDFERPGNADFEPPAVPSEPEAQRIIRDLGYNSVRVREYVKDPIQFIGDRAFLDGDLETYDHVQSYYRQDITMREVIRLIPTFKLGYNLKLKGGEISGGTSVHTEALYDLLTDDGVRASLREQILANPAELYDTADQVREMHYSHVDMDAEQAANDPDFDSKQDFFEVTERYNPSNPDAVPYETLVMQNADFANIYTALQLERFNSEELDGLFQSDLPVEERLQSYLNNAELSYEEFQKGFVGTLDRLLPSAVGQEIVDAVEAGVANEQFFREFNASIDNSRAQFGAFVSVLNIVDPKTAENINKLGQGTLNMAEGLGNLLNDSLSSTEIAANIGLAATGYGMVVVAFQAFQKQQEASVEAQRFEAIVRNQQIMLEYLKQIDAKVDVLDQRIQRLSFILQQGVNEILIGLQDLKEELNDVRQQQIENADKALLREQQGELFRQVALEQEFLDYLRRVIAGSDTAEEQRADAHRCWVNGNCAYADVASLRSQYLRLQSNRMAFVNTGLPYQEAFVDNQNIAGFSPDRIEGYLQRPVDDRIGAMPSIAGIVFREFNLEDELISDDPVLTERQEELRSIVTGLSRSVTHPAYFEDVTSGYVETALTFPTSQVIEQDLANIRRSASELQRYAQNAREAVPYLAEIYLGKVEAYLSEVERQIRDSSELRAQYGGVPAPQGELSFVSGFRLPNSTYGVLMDQMDSLQVEAYIDELDIWELAYFASSEGLADSGLRQTRDLTLAERERFFPNRRTMDGGPAHPLFTWAFQNGCAFNVRNSNDVIGVDILRREAMWKLAEGERVTVALGGAPSSYDFATITEYYCQEEYFDPTVPFPRTESGRFDTVNVFVPEDEAEDSFRDRISRYVVRQHQRIMREAVQNADHLYSDVQVVRLALDTVIRAGYGECLGHSVIGPQTNVNAGRDVPQPRDTPTPVDMPRLSSSDTTEQLDREAEDGIYRWNILKATLREINSVDPGYELPFPIVAPMQEDLKRMREGRIELAGFDFVKRRLVTNRNLRALVELEPFSNFYETECSMGFSYQDDIRHVLDVADFYLQTN